MIATSSRRALGVLATLGAIATLAGCGGSGSPAHTVRTAATDTLALTTQSTLRLTGTRLFGGNPGAIAGRAQYSFPRGLGYEALQVPAVGAQAAGTAYLVFLPHELWTRPVVRSALPAGHLWISATFGRARPARPAASLALVLEAMNPQLLLDEIATGTVAASSSGHGVTDHVPYTEYAVSVDLARSIAASSGAGALHAAMQQELSALRTSGGTRALISVRVDGSGRIVQLQASLPGSRLGTVQIALRTFGSTIPLSLPLPSQTVDIASLAGVTARRALTGS